jgi:hypothetical protein
MIMEQAVLELPRNLLNQVGEIAKSHGVEIDTLVQQILKDYLRTQATPSLSRREKSRAIHEVVKANIAEKYPHLKKQRSKKEVQERFDNITEKIRRRMQCETLEELEKAIRGDELGLVRY